MKQVAIAALNALEEYAQALRDDQFVNDKAHREEMGVRMINRIHQIKTFVENSPEPNDITARMERMENYLEAAFLAANFQHTENVAKVCESQLVRHPKDINVISLVMKLDNDQKIIEPRMRTVNCAVWQSIVDRYGNGGTLKYFDLKPHVNEKSNLHVITK